MPDLYGLDFETYASVDLKKVKLARYIEDPFFRPLRVSMPQYNGSWNSYDLTLDQHLDRFITDWNTLPRDAVVAPFNADFERAVLERMGLSYDRVNIVDAAATARRYGAGRKLEAAAPQLLGSTKKLEGQHLINLFCKPSREQIANNDLAFNEDLPLTHAKDWSVFGEYCDKDAELGVLIQYYYGPPHASQEFTFERITSRMNFAGWCVDLDSVRAMKAAYEENIAKAEQDFRVYAVAPDLNLNSLKQLKEWCADRGVRASSFNADNVERLLTRLYVRVAQPGLSATQTANYNAVIRMLETKQIIGGSSLKKLDTILNLVSSDGRLRHNYIHAGAAQTWRTSGVGVQLQNLKRLNDPDNPDEMVDFDLWDNDELAGNLRQVFTSSKQYGHLLVGDLSSIEARGLAWFAQDMEKLRAFEQGLDMYKVQATKMYHVSYDAVSSEQRRAGKVAELSCGYNAGGEAVAAFAEGMGIKMDLQEAEALVNGWRDTNPLILELWVKLQTAIERAICGLLSTDIQLLDDFMLEIDTQAAPQSLKEQTNHGTTLVVSLYQKNTLWFRRYFHGIHQVGRNFQYYRAADTANGALWRDGYMHPKKKVFVPFTIYGGKMAGIITQSFCREIFFRITAAVSTWCDQAPAERTLIGQFHDELIVDHTGTDHAAARSRMQELMQPAHLVPSLPIHAKVLSNYRYNK